MGISVKLEGGRELRERLMQLQADAIERMVPIAVSNATALVRDESHRDMLRQRAIRTGTMIKNVAMKRQKGTPYGFVQYNVGVRSGYRAANGRAVGAGGVGVASGARKVSSLYRDKRGNVHIRNSYTNNPWYWRFLELGTKHIKERRFIQDALSRKAPDALGTMVGTLRTQLATF